MGMRCFPVTDRSIGVERHKATFATETCTIVAFGWSAGLYGAITTALCQGLSMFSMAVRSFIWSKLALNKQRNPHTPCLNCSFHLQYQLGQLLTVPSSRTVAVSPVAPSQWFASQVKGWSYNQPAAMCKHVPTILVRCSPGMSNRCGARIPVIEREGISC